MNVDYLSIKKGVSPIIERIGYSPVTSLKPEYMKSYLWTYASIFADLLNLH